MAVVQVYPALKRQERPVCSICIANYNGVALLPECLDSILAQSCGFEFEILVHDDASSDGSVAWLRNHHPGIELIASAENVGFCISNNRMAEQARGQYLLLLNNDAALMPGALSALKRLADASPGVLTLPQYDWQTGALVDRGCLLDPFYNPVPNLDRERSKVAMAIGACLWIPKDLWDEIGGFPEWIESIGEDMLLCCEARLRGLPVLAAVESGYRHWQGKSFGGNKPEDGKLQTTFRRRRLSERNKTAVMVIATPGFLAWLLLAVHLVALAAEGAIVSVVGRDARPWTGIYWPAITFPFRQFAILRARRSTAQAARRASLQDYLQPMAWVPQKIRLLLRHGFPRIR